MTKETVQLIETNPIGEYRFVGRDGDRITLHASPLLATLSRFSGSVATELFAIPVFNDKRSHVTWYSRNSGQLEAFWELPDDRQNSVLDELETTAAKVYEATAKLGAIETSESLTYTRLLPLLLNFPVPVEYHLYLVNGRPVATHWGMNKQIVENAQDTLTPFIAQWRERLALRQRQIHEAERNTARENSFLGRLLRAGAASGAVEVSLMWNDENDLDLHVGCPNGKTLYFANKTECGGILDIDRNAHVNTLTAQPVENIVWTNLPMCKGRYTVYVHFFRQHARQPASCSFTLRLKRGSQVQHFEGSVVVGERQQVATFDV